MILISVQYLLIETVTEVQPHMWNFKPSGRILGVKPDLLECWIDWKSIVETFSQALMELNNFGPQYKNGPVRHTAAMNPTGLQWGKRLLCMSHLWQDNRYLRCHDFCWCHSTSKLCLMSSRQKTLLAAGNLHSGLVDAKQAKAFAVLLTLRLRMCYDEHKTKKCTRCSSIEFKH